MSSPSSKEYFLYFRAPLWFWSYLSNLPFHRDWMGAEGGYPGFCRKLYSTLLIKTPTETAHVSKASAKTEGNGSYPLLRGHQSNFWNWIYNYDRVLWFSLLTARLSATLCRQSGTGDLHSAAFFQVMLFSERRHSAEWPSISQLWIQVFSQQILDELCLETALWSAFELAVVEGEVISALDPAEGRGWLRGLMPDPRAVESTTHCLCITVVSVTDETLQGMHFGDYHTSWVIKVPGQLRYVIITQKSTGSRGLRRSYHFLLKFCLLQQKPGAAIAVERWDTQKSGKPCSEHGFNHPGKGGFLKELGWPHHAASAPPASQICSGCQAELTWLSTGWDYPKVISSFLAVTGDGNWLFTFKVRLME